MATMIYGAFPGGDPRKFQPDHECCSENELANHKASCKLWDAAEANGETPTPEACPSGWVYDSEGKPLYHILKSPYGLGVYEYDDGEMEEEIESPHGKAVIAVDEQGHYVMIKKPNLWCFDQESDPKNNGFGTDGDYGSVEPGIYLVTYSFSQHYDWESGIPDDFEFEPEKMILIWDFNCYVRHNLKILFLSWWRGEFK